MNGNQFRRLMNSRGAEVYRTRQAGFMEAQKNGLVKPLGSALLNGLLATSKTDLAGSVKGGRS